MPRRYKLTWQDGGNRQGGRWRKKYKGEIYYFPGGRGKTDRDAYQAALDAWDETKSRIDASAPKPHDPEYRQAIAEWETVLSWSRKHQDDSMANRAVEKLAMLRKEFSARKPNPVRREDTFAGQFDLDPRLKSLYRETASAVIATTELLTPDRKTNESSAETIIDPTQLDRDVDAPDSREVDRAVWSDRLAVMQRDVAPETALGAFVEKFLAGKAASVAAGELSTARIYALRLHLDEFADWYGRGAAVTDVTGQTLTDYRVELLKRIEKNEWSSTTAKDRLSTVKSFVSWLWQIEAIPALPRILAGKSAALRIGKSQSEIVVFSKGEISTLLKHASDRTKLYILLMLNCGMTQKDIADLQHDEVDWAIGRITRKRSKTRKHDNVPEVSYPLWVETLRLLEQERSDEGAEAVLLNENGERIWMDKVLDGKYQKNDNVRSAFGRLCKKTKIKKPLKSLKKTSATLIRGNPKYASLESLFLGHAAGTIAHRHYTQPPQDLLDDAIGWLGTELAIQ